MSQEENDPAAETEPTAQRPSIRRVLNTLGIVSAPLGALSLLETFGPAHQYRSWLANIAQVYDDLLAQLAQALARFGIDIPHWAVEANVLALLFLGICARILTADGREGFRHLRRDVAQTIWSEGFGFTALGVFLGIYYVSSLGGVRPREALAFALDVSLNTVVISAIPAVAAVLLVTIGNALLRFRGWPHIDGDYEPSRRFVRNVIEQTAVTIGCYVVIFVLGTKFTTEF